jgi:hypothetical protein
MRPGLLQGKSEEILACERGGWRTILPAYKYGVRSSWHCTLHAWSQFIACGSRCRAMVQSGQTCPATLQRRHLGSRSRSPNPCSMSLSGA